MVLDARVESLLKALASRIPEAQTERLLSTYRQTELGLLSVGLKIHCREHIQKLDDFMWELKKEAHEWQNRFVRTEAVQCWVLPPVGCASAAIHIIEALEVAVDIKIFGNPLVELQACSPGQLSPEGAAFLSIGKYLGGDTIKRYGPKDLETSFSSARRRTEDFIIDEKARWGRRLALYDDGGVLETKFEWWRDARGELEIQPELPFKEGRTDILDASSRRDIRNVNLLATVLLHEEFGGYWGSLGYRLKDEMRQMLERHMLSGILFSPWITTGTTPHANDLSYFASLTELCEYALEETERIEDEEDTSNCILFEMRDILDGILDEIQLRAEEATREEPE